MENFSGIKIHLTMYGIPFEKRIKSIKRKKNIMVIVGGEKVPREVYELSDENIAVTNQPHSEVGALAVFLYALGQKKIFNGGLRIIPQKKGKLIES